MFSRTFVLGMIVLIAVGCGLRPKTSDKNIDPIDVKKLDAMWRDSKRPALLVDVRPQRRYEMEHIPGAVNVPISELGEADPRLAEAQNIIVYSGGWQDLLSRAAAKKLIVLGYSNVYDFAGGLEAWKAEGRRVEGTGPMPPSATAPAEPTPVAPEQGAEPNVATDEGTTPLNPAPRTVPDEPVQPVITDAEPAQTPAPAPEAAPMPAEAPAPAEAPEPAETPAAEEAPAPAEAPAPEEPMIK